MNIQYNPQEVEEKILRKQRIIKVLKQRGKMPVIKLDIQREALLPGKRISKAGKIYWETRKNRSDAPGSKI